MGISVCDTINVLFPVKYIIIRFFFSYRAYVFLLHTMFTYTWTMLYTKWYLTRSFYIHLHYDDICMCAVYTLFKLWISAPTQFQFHLVSKHGWVCVTRSHRIQWLIFPLVTLSFSHFRQLFIFCCLTNTFIMYYMDTLSSWITKEYLFWI